MSVKTKFEQEDIKAILSLYDLGALTQTEPIQRGTVQTNYFIQTTEGRFVLRYYENRYKESVYFESDLLEYLANHQYPCPRQISNKQGANVGEFQNKPYVIFRFIDGRAIEKPTAKDWQQLIQKAAELQLITQSFKSQHASHRLNYDRDSCLTLANERARALATPQSRAKAIWLERELESLELPPELPRGICHCDFHFSNVLFQNNKLVALLDFDDANLTFLPFDLVGLIEYWAWPHPAAKPNLAKASTVVKEYEKHRPLSAVEGRHLFDVYKLTVLFDCVWYFDRGTVDGFYEKRKIEALDELGRERFLSLG